MPKIIISYRRADSDAIAGRIRDKIANYYGTDSVFMDIDNIPFGMDFRDHIRDALFENDILVVIVGSKWVGPGKGGHLRIQEENDPVRIEVETALERGIPVIPVLVNNATMPKPSELPDTLRNFAYRNAAEVDAGRDFHAHMDRLLRAMDKILIGRGKTVPSQEPDIAPPASPPRVEAPSIAAPEPEPAPRVDPTPSAVVAPAAAAARFATSSAAAPGPAAPSLASLTPQPTAPAGPPRLGLIIALSAGGSAALAAAAVAGMMWFYAGRMQPPAPPVQPPAQDAQVIMPQRTPAVTVPAAATADTCRSPTAAAFNDEFKTPDPGWGLTDANETVYVDGQFAIKAEAGSSWAIVYRSLLYRNATVCLDVKSPPSVKMLDRPAGGVIFWAADYRNYYTMLIYPDATYRISRKINGNWATIATRKKFDAIKPGLGVVNQLKVTTLGATATLTINGSKVQDIKGQPPANGGAVGIFGESEKDQVNDWRYLGIMVTELPAPRPGTGSPPEAVVKAMLAACRGGATAAFADDFSATDTAWIGVPSESSYVADGQMKIKAVVNASWRIAYWALVFKDVTICTDVKSPVGFKAPDDTSAGVIFWATDFDNYYSVSLFPDGSYAIDRRVSGSVVKVAPKAPHASIKKGPDAENRVKITLAGGTGTLLINDVKVQDFRGQPPPAGGSIGLFGESETGQRDEWSFTGVVVAETAP